MHLSKAGVFRVELRVRGTANGQIENGIEPRSYIEAIKIDSTYCYGLITNYYAQALTSLL